MNVPSGDCYYSEDVKTSVREKRAIVAALSAIFHGINILGRLMIKATYLWLCYKILKEITYAMEALYKNDKLFSR